MRRPRSTLYEKSHTVLAHELSYDKIRAHLDMFTIRWGIHQT